jgi:hypothetical protein
MRKRRRPCGRAACSIEFAKGNAVDAAQALPLYLRDKVALKTNERNIIPSPMHEGEERFK